MASSAQSEQFLRAGSLFLVNDSQSLDLSNLRFVFETTASDVETPNIARIRVYNLSENTRAQAINEFSGVILSAGYRGTIGQIFKGTIKQFRKGKERNIDSFLDIYAADGDVAYNTAIINQSFAQGSTPGQHLEAIASAMGLPLDKNAMGYLTTGGIIPQPRGKVFFGLARSYMRDLAQTNNVRWSIQNGVLTLIPLTSYLPGAAVVINSATGMVGVPEATDQGINVMCLLNPQIQVGRLIQLNNKDVTQTIIKQQFFPGYTDLNFPAAVDPGDDGKYRVLVVEHEGDTRGTPWYTRITCLSVNPDVAAGNSVLPFG